VLIQKRQVQGPYTFAAQMLLNPAGDTSMGFKREWLAYMDGQPHASGQAVYMVVDPAHSKKKGSDYSVFAVIGIGRDGVYRLLDMVRDRLNLTEKAHTLIELWGRWRPIRVGYERVGMQSDTQHIRQEQHRQSISFPLIELGANTPKVDRIRKLVPLFEQGKFLLPRYLNRTGYDGKTTDLIRALVEEEYVTFPYGGHDDMLDCIAMVLHPHLNARAMGGGYGESSGWVRPSVQGLSLPNRRRGGQSSQTMPGGQYRGTDGGIYRKIGWRD
jgi:predicted phage terminase large subunit-like protein